MVALVASLWVYASSSRADVAQADSPSFPLDTILAPPHIGGIAIADSSLFALETRPYWGPFFAGPSADSGAFTVDTRGGGLAVGGGVVAVYPAISYSPATRTLSVSMQAIDPLYGRVTSGNFGWLVTVKDGASIAGGSGSYNAAAGQWQAGATLGTALAGGSYQAIYTITSDRNRQGWAMLPLTVAGPGVVVNGTVKDASTQWPLSAAQVAIFPAGGAGGLWTLVNSQYGGLMPSLATLLGQLTPVKPTITTGADGTFSWADVPVGNSYVIVAARSGYGQKWSDSFNVSAAGVGVTRNFELTALDQTLAAVLNEVRSARARLESVLCTNALVVGSLSQQFYEDTGRKPLDWWDGFNFLGSLSGAASGGLAISGSGEVLPSEMFKILVKVGDKCHGQLAKVVGDAVVGWAYEASFPRSYVEYLQAEPHTYYSNSIRQSECPLNS